MDQILNPLIPLLNQMRRGQRTETAAIEVLKIAADLPADLAASIGAITFEAYRDPKVRQKIAELKFPNFERRQLIDKLAMKFSPLDLTPTGFLAYCEILAGLMQRDKILAFSPEPARGTPHLPTLGVLFLRAQAGNQEAAARLRETLAGYDFRVGREAPQLFEKLPWLKEMLADYWPSPRPTRLRQAAEVIAREWQRSRVAVGIAVGLAAILNILVIMVVFAMSSARAAAPSAKTTEAVAMPKVEERPKVAEWDELLTRTFAELVKAKAVVESDTLVILPHPLATTIEATAAACLSCRVMPEYEVKAAFGSKVPSAASWLDLPLVQASLLKDREKATPPGRVLIVYVEPVGGGLERVVVYRLSTPTATLASITGPAPAGHKRPTAVEFLEIASQEFVLGPVQAQRVDLLIRMALAQAQADSSGNEPSRDLADVYLTQGRILHVRGQVELAREAIRRGLRYLPREQWNQLPDLLLRQYQLDRTLDDQWLATHQIVPPTLEHNANSEVKKP